MARLPPLNALRAFEAAARHLSFTKAAEELHVTPAAISHQIRALEEDLGVCLFRRLPRQLLLTDAGQAAAPRLREAFLRLEEAVGLARGPATSGILTVSAAPSFASEWLVPRLDRFRARHPDIDVRVDPSMRLADFHRDGIDIAIRFGPGHYPGLRVDRLFDDAVFPVAAPKVREGPPPLLTPADLARATLLHHEYPVRDDRYPTWPMWLHAAGLDGIDASRGPRFTAASHAIQAAIAGQGVALSSRVLASHALSDGRLVRLFELGLPLAFCYYVVSPEHTAEQPKIAAFRDWILAEAARENDVA